MNNPQSKKIKHILIIAGILFSLQCLVFFIPKASGRLCVLIDKASHTLKIKAGESLNFPVSLGIDPVSPKYRRGDGATPEGLYYITYMKNKSRFHKFIGISYPNIVDAWLGVRSGILGRQDQKRIVEAVLHKATPPQDTSLGGGIGIHGGGVMRKIQGRENKDWTQGCIAMDDEDIDRIFSLCRLGTPVIIYNSKAGFFDMMRPFAYPVDLCDTGREHVSSIGLLTKFGPVLLTLRESNDYNRAIMISIYGQGIDHLPTCEIIDQNGDGDLGFRDKTIGSLGKIRGEDIYNIVKREIVKALSMGKIRVETTGWSP